MLRMYRGTRYRNRCGNESIKNSRPDCVFIVVSLWANVISKAADYGLIRKRVYERTGLHL